MKSTAKAIHYNGKHEVEVYVEKLKDGTISLRAGGTTLHLTDDEALNLSDNLFRAGE